MVPWIMWSGHRAAELDWFLDELFAFLAKTSAKSVVRALTHAYVFYFDAGRQSFERVASYLLEHALRTGDRLGDKWLEFHRRCEILHPRSAPSRIAKLALAAPEVLVALDEVGIGPEQLDGGLARSAFETAYKAVAQDLARLSDERETTHAVDRLFSWGASSGGLFRYQTLLAPMATALLEGLARANASIETQERIVRYFVDHFGDPRLKKAKWRQVSQDAFDFAMRILVRATLEDFTRVIDATAEARHWRERKPFWLRYYEIGAVDDAWVAFGPKAVSHAGQLERRYALLYHANERTHSALIIRIRDLIVVEWSHNGRCRFFPRNAGSWAPELYAGRYDFLELHNYSDSSGGYLNHMNNWQYRFAHRIFLATNIRHPEFGSGWE